MAGQVQQLSLPQPVLDLYLRDHSVLVVDEDELAGRHPLQHRIGLVQWNLLHSFQLLQYNRSDLLLVLPDGGQDGVCGGGEELLLLLPVQDEPPGQAGVQHLPQIICAD